MAHGARRVIVNLTLAIGEFIGARHVRNAHCDFLEGVSQHHIRANLHAVHLAQPVDKRRKLPDTRAILNVYPP